MERGSMREFSLSVVDPPAAPLSLAVLAEKDFTAGTLGRNGDEAAFTQKEGEFALLPTPDLLRKDH